MSESVAVVSSWGRVFAEDEEAMGRLKRVLGDVTDPLAIRDLPAEMAASIYGEMALAWPLEDDAKLRMMAASIVCRLNRDHPMR